jgi:pimeloyl-ACP methyl ester carboxylesterase
VVFLHGWPESWRSCDPARITAGARASYVEAYSTDTALTSGFNWYRAFPLDAEHNGQLSPAQITTRLLYLRGEHEGGEIGAYVTGFREAGWAHVDHAVVPGAGHFTQEEAPEDTWRLVAGFLGG